MGIEEKIQKRRKTTELSWPKTRLLSGKCVYDWLVSIGTVCAAIAGFLNSGVLVESEEEALCVQYTKIGLTSAGKSFRSIKFFGRSCRLREQVAMLLTNALFPLYHIPVIT